MNQTLKKSLFIIAGALMLLMSAYINGYPIVYADTSTYIASGFELEAPFDRPITYGLFLRLTSLNGVSLWLVVFFQSLLVSFLIFKLLKTYLPHIHKLNLFFLFTIAGLSVFTSASWTASQLIGDIFTPIVVLSLLLLVNESSGKKFRIPLYVIFFFATAVHMSHLSFNTFFIASLLIARQLKFLGIKDQIKLRPLLICLGLTVMSILTMGSALSKSRHGFLMGSLVEHGIAKEFLDEHCDKNNYKMCAFKDSLPDKAWVFLWEENSPFYKMGGWKETKEEFSDIIYQTLTRPKYIGLHIKESMKATGDQLTKFGIGDGNGSFLEGTLLHKRIKKYFTGEVGCYEASRQNTTGLKFLHWYNVLLYVVVMVSILILTGVFFRSHQLDKAVLAMIVMTLLAVLVNAWACGTLANAIDRLGGKIMWLIPLISLIGTASIFSKKQLH